MEKSKEDNKQRPRRSLRKKEVNEINVVPKKVSQHQPSPEQHHINVLNTKLNNAMARISELEWENENLENKILSLNESLKKQTGSLKHYKSRVLKHDKQVNAMVDQYETEISSISRELDNIKIQHEADMLDKEKIILNQNERISKQESSIQEMHVAREFSRNDDNIVKSKAGLLLDMIVFYENLSRVLKNDGDEINLLEDNKSMTKKIKQLIKEFKNSPNFKSDITNQVILSQLNDILKYIENVSEYVKNKEVLKQGMLIVIKDFKEVLNSEGVEEVHTYDEEYNPVKHEIVAYENDENTEDGYVIEEISKGYALNGKIIKPAQVKVCKKD